MLTLPIKANILSLDNTEQCIYLVLSGSLSIQKRQYSDQNDTNQNLFYKTAIRWVFSYIDVVEIGPTQSYSTFNAPRSTKIVANSDCELGYITKPNYDNIIKAIEVKQSDKIIKFLRQSDFIKLLDAKSKKRLIDDSKTCYFSRGQTIINEKECQNELYMVYQGEVEVVTKSWVYKENRDSSNTRLPLNRLLTGSANTRSRVKKQHIKHTRVLGTGNLVAHSDVCDVQNHSRSVNLDTMRLVSNKFKAIWKSSEAVMVKLSVVLLRQAIKKNPDLAEIVTK